MRKQVNFRKQKFSCFPQQELRKKGSGFVAITIKLILAIALLLGVGYVLKKMILG